MPADTFQKTAAELRSLASKHQAVLVAFSGGKDSLAVLDLCSRAFGLVACFHMEAVPGLACIEDRLSAARDRYKVEVLRYPHWSTVKALKDGVFCNDHVSLSDLPEYKLADVYALAREDTGIRLIAHGGRSSDGLWRRRMFANTEGSAGYKDVCYPVKGWTKYDVLAYLQANKIPAPKEYRDDRAGVGLNTAGLLWLADEFPDDFKKLLRYFPYAESVLLRRKWFGVK